MPAPILETQGVTVEFDGFRALNGLDFSVQSGELRVVIGPNGAGKTTLLDVISGQEVPAAGRVRFKGRDITGMPVHQVSRLGIGRKFQTPSVFENLTPHENLQLAWNENKAVGKTLRSRLTTPVHDQIHGILEHVSLLDKAEWPAAALSHGEKQWLEIGMLIVQDPDLLLIDEPVAGMTDEETEKTGQLLLSIAQDQTIVVIEHDMDFVKQIAQKVTVLHEGTLLCEGTVDEVQRNPQVVQIYLGRERQGNGQANAQG
jgi:urea transport system ATP-binding protein